MNLELARVPNPVVVFLSSSELTYHWYYQAVIFHVCETIYLSYDWSTVNKLASLKDATSLITGVDARDTSVSQNQVECGLWNL